MISPYVIELELLLKLQVHFIFNSNPLEPTTTNLPYLGHMQPFRPPIKIDKKIKYKISDIVDFCFYRKTKKF